MDEIAKQIATIGEAIVSRKIPLNIIANAINEFNQKWGAFIPIEYKIDVTEKRGTYAHSERFETSIGMQITGNSYSTHDNVNMTGYPILKGVTHLVFAPESDESENKNELEFLSKLSIFKEKSDDKSGDVKISKQENTF